MAKEKSQEEGSHWVKHRKEQNQDKEGQNGKKEIRRRRESGSTVDGDLTGTSNQVPPLITDWDGGPRSYQKCGMEKGHKGRVKRSLSEVAASTGLAPACQAPAHSSLTQPPYNVQSFQQGYSVVGRAEVSGAHSERHADQHPDERPAAWS